VKNSIEVQDCFGKLPLLSLPINLLLGPLPGYCTCVHTPVACHCPQSCKSQLCVHTLLIFVSDVFYCMLLCMCTTTLHHREYQFFTSSVHGGEQEGRHSFRNWARVLEHQEQQSWPKNFLSHKQTQSESLRCKHFPSCLISWSKHEGQFRVPVALQDSHFVDPAVTVVVDQKLPHKQ